MATVKGTSIIFGNGTVSATITGLGTLNLLQGGDYSLASQSEQVADKDGATATKSFYDFKRTASLDFVASNGSASATPTTITSLLAPGTTLALTNAGVPAVDDTYMVDEGGPQVTTSNTGAVRIRLGLEAFLDNNVP